MKEMSIKIQGFFDEKVIDYLETRDIFGTPIYCDCHFIICDGSVTQSQFINLGILFKF